jgi:hypothetical protein
MARDLRPGGHIQVLVGIGPSSSCDGCGDSTRADGCQGGSAFSQPGYSPYQVHIPQLGFARCWQTAEMNIAELFVGRRGDHHEATLLFALYGAGWKVAAET